MKNGNEIDGTVKYLAILDLTVLITNKNVIDMKTLMYKLISANHHETNTVMNHQHSINLCPFQKL